MLAPNYVSVLQFFIAGALLCFAYGYMYRRTKVDRFREDIFTLRDETFDYMWKHDLPYSHPAYLLTRSALNGTIRFSGYWSLPVFAMMLYYASRTPPSHEVTNAIKMLPPQHRNYFDAIRWRIWRRLLNFVFLEGFCGWIVGGIRRLAKSVSRDGISSASGLTRLVDPLTEELVQVGASRYRVGRGVFQGRSAA